MTPNQRNNVMTKEEKDLLLKDLSARLPYGVICDCLHDYHTKASAVDAEGFTVYYPYCDEWESIEYCKPYLRPMSSMTEEEYVYFMNIRGRNLRSYETQEIMSENFSHPNRIAIVNTLGRYFHNIDWLDKNMFDYRGLIPKGLAIEVTEENNPYKD